MPTLPLVAFRLRMQSLTRWATLALGLTLLSLNAAAQDLPEPGEGFAWERLDGATPDARDLAFVTDADGDPRTLWVESGSGLYRLDFSGGTPAEWVLVNDRTAHFRILPLGGDTLVATRANSTWRSLDGGATWAQVHDEGFEGLYGIPSGYARAGRLIGLAQIGANSAPVHRAEPLVAGPVPAEPGVSQRAPHRLGLGVRPNPASGPVEGVLALRSAAVEVAVYDGLGRKVTTLHEEALPVSERTLRLATAALPAGVYFVRVTAHTLDGAATAAAPPHPRPLTRRAHRVRGEALRYE